MFFLNETDTKKLAKSLTRSLKKTHTELALGQVLDALAASRGHTDWNSLSAALSPQGINSMLSSMEQEHTYDSEEAEQRLKETGMKGFGPECILKVHTGFELRTAAYPDEVDYVRVCDPLGREIAYWSIDEFRDDPADVLGAMMGALARGSAVPESSVLHKVSLPDIQDLDFSEVTAVILDGQYFRVLGTDQDNLEKLKELFGEVNRGQQPGEEDDRLGLSVLTLYVEEDGLDTYELLTAGQLLSAKWNPDTQVFETADGSTVEFILAKTFGKTCF